VDASRRYLHAKAMARLGVKPCLPRGLHISVAATRTSRPDHHIEDLPSGRRARDRSLRLLMMRTTISSK
jgi:hypothetical protein